MLAVEDFSTGPTAWTSAVIVEHTHCVLVAPGPHLSPGTSINYSVKDTANGPVLVLSHAQQT